MRFLRYCRDVFFVALRPSISWAQFIIALIIIVVGCAIWLATALGMILDLSGLVALVRSPAFYVILLGAVVVVRLVFAQYWMWNEEHDARVVAETKMTQLSGPVITPVQERMLGLIANYQGQFAVNKLVVGRDGDLIFDRQRDKGKGINLIVDLYGANTPVTQQNFVDLMDEIPTEYLRYIPEMRWNSPFVVSVTNRGMGYLKGLSG